MTLVLFLTLSLPRQRERRACLCLTMLGIWDLSGSSPTFNWSSSIAPGSWLREGGEDASCGVSWGLRSAYVGQNLKGQGCDLVRTHYGKIMSQTQCLEEVEGTCLVTIKDKTCLLLPVHAQTTGLLFLRLT